MFNLKSIAMEQQPQKQRFNYFNTIAQNIDYKGLKQVLALKDKLRYIGNEKNHQLTTKALKR
jgi:hypothetical protein